MQTLKKQATVNQGRMLVAKNTVDYKGPRWLQRAQLATEIPSQPQSDGARLCFTQLISIRKTQGRGYCSCPTLAALPR